LLSDGSDNLTQISIPSRDHYHFAGYWTSISGGTQVISGTGAWLANGVMALNSDGVLYARWTAHSYSITYFDVGGGAFSGENSWTMPSVHRYDMTTTLSQSTKFGYFFEGWFTNVNGTGMPVTQLNAFAHTSNITLYAKWEKNTGDWLEVGRATTWDTLWLPFAGLPVYAPGAVSASQFRIRTADGEPLSMTVNTNMSPLNSFGMGTSSSGFATGSDVWNLSEPLVVVTCYGDVVLWAEYLDGVLYLFITTENPCPTWIMWVSFDDEVIIEVNLSIVAELTLQVCDEGWWDGIIFYLENNPFIEFTALDLAGNPTTDVEWSISLVGPIEATVNSNGVVEIVSLNGYYSWIHALITVTATCTVTNSTASMTVAIVMW
jgi:uncharacterized repeat protein (TIGR02543 family)